MTQTLIKITDDHYVVVDSNENITHTTNLSYHDNLDYIKLSISEVKELIGDVDETEWEVTFDEQDKLRLV